MKIVRSVVVFDAADLHAESAFWAAMLGGRVFEDETWHTVIDATGHLGGSACSWRSTTFPPTGRTAARSSYTSTCTSRTLARPTRRRSGWAPACFDQLPT